LAARGHVSEPINTAINQMLDAATLQNAGGGFLGSGINIRGGSMPFRIGEWKRVEVVNNAPLRDNVFRLDHPGPSAVLFQPAGDADRVRQGNHLGSGRDDRRGHDQSARDDDARSDRAGPQGHDRHLQAHPPRVRGGAARPVRLNRDYLDEEEYFLLNDGDQGQQIAREDYDDSDLDVVPVSDPNIVTDMQKLARSEAEWASFNGDPLINQVELRRRRMEVLGTPDPDTMLKVPAPAPIRRCCSKRPRKPAPSRKGRPRWSSPMRTRPTCSAMRRASCLRPIFLRMRPRWLRLLSISAA
jgi:chaperonin GroES